jgi:hypothetical protein
MIFLIGLTLSLSAAIAIYFLRQWFLTFRPQTKSFSSSISKPPGYTALLSVLFYVLILPLSYLELLWEMCRDQKPKRTNKQNSSIGSDIQNMIEY